MDEQQNGNRSELSNLSVRDLFHKYVRFTPLILLSVAIALLMAFAYLRYATRIYSSTGNMFIESSQTASRDKVEDILAGSSKGMNIQSEIEMLKSTPLMERVVRKLNLQIGYYAKGTVIKSLNVYKQTPFILQPLEISDSSAVLGMKIKFNSEGGFTINDEGKVFHFGQVFKNSFGVFRILAGKGGLSSTAEYNVTWQPAQMVAAGLVGGLRIMPKSAGTDIVSINFQTTNGQMAADIVNNLMVQYDSMTVEQKNYSADQMIIFINERLNKLKLEIDSVQSIELALRQEYKLVDVNIQSSQYLDKIQAANEMLSQQELRIEAINNVNTYVKDKENQYARVVPSSLGLEDITLNSLVEGYNKAQMERQILVSSNIPAANPAVKEAEAVIEKQRQNLLENLRNLRMAYLGIIGDIQRKSIADEKRVQSFPSKLKNLIEVQRQVTTKLALYTLLEQKREEAGIGRSATISSSKIMDWATAPGSPIKPNKKAIQLLAVLVGLGVPILLIFMSEVLNDKVTTRYDIEKLTGASILGEVGHSYSEKVLIVNKSSRSMVAEQFRIIRSNLQYVLNKKEKFTILVTSSFSGEGKSFISTNMGAVLALTGKKAIILEFDIRKPKVLSGLGMRKSAGISNYLVGKGELQDLIVKVPENDNLYVLPCGPVPPNPSELLLDPKVSEMFEWLREQFDVIIIDTAPVGMVSDAMTLGKFADCTLYIVRQGYTFKKQVALIDELYKAEKLNKISIVINDVKVKPGYGYYGYGRYGYGYGYGQSNKTNSYYDEEKAPPFSWKQISKKLNPRNLFGKK